MSFRVGDYVVCPSCGYEYNECFEDFVEDVGEKHKETCEDCGFQFVISKIDEDTYIVDEYEDEDEDDELDEDEEEDEEEDEDDDY